MVNTPEMTVYFIKLLRPFFLLILSFLFLNINLLNYECHQQSQGWLILPLPLMHEVSLRSLFQTLLGDWMALPGGPKKDSGWGLRVLCTCNRSLVYLQSEQKTKTFSPFTFKPLLLIVLDVHMPLSELNGTKVTDKY